MSVRTAISNPFKPYGNLQVGSTFYPVYGSKEQPFFQVRDVMEMLGYSRAHKELLDKISRKDIFRASCVKKDNLGRLCSRETDMISLKGVLALAANAMNNTHSRRAGKVFNFIFDKWVNK